MNTCPICKKDYIQITKKHVNTHGISLDEFKIKYPEVNLGNYNANITNHKQKMDRVLKNNIRCLECDIIISVVDRKRKKFCSRSCCNKYKKKNGVRNDKRICITCHKEYISSHKMQKHCSIKCHWESKQKQYLDHWLNGIIDNTTENTTPPIKRYLLTLRGAKCEECGWNKISEFTKKSPLQVHHVDGNSKNNTPENLKILCPNCHSLTPSFGGLNRGKGRKGRYNKKADII